MQKHFSLNTSAHTTLSTPRTRLTGKLSRALPTPPLTRVAVLILVPQSATNQQL